MQRGLLVIAVLLAVAVPVSAATAATLGPRLLGAEGVRVKPPRIGVGAKGVFEGLRWRNWGTASAQARGVYDIAGFAGEPGTGYRSRIWLRVGKRKRCADGSLVYTRVRYRVRKPLGGRRVFRERFSTCRRG